MVAGRRGDGGGVHRGGSLSAGWRVAGGWACGRERTGRPGVARSRWVGVWALAPGGVGAVRVGGPTRGELGALG